MIRSFPAAIVFDMDGLLLETERQGLRAWEAAAKEFGYVVDHALYLKLLGRVQADSRKILEAELGVEFPYDKVRARRLVIGQEIIDTEGIPLRPGAAELLDYLRTHGAKIAVATSTERKRAEARLTLTKIIGRLDALVCGDEISKGKPDPEIFLRCLSLLNVEPSAAWVLEDSETGIHAAKKAGVAAAVLIPDLKPPSDEIQAIADMIVADLGAVQLKLEALRTK